MKVIIAGSRQLTLYRYIGEAVQSSGFDVTEVVSGCARGIDTLAITWANHHEIPVTQFPADWSTHPRHAGILRNIQMARYADALIAIWDGKSRGTAHMISQAEKRRLKVHIIIK